MIDDKYAWLRYTLGESLVRTVQLYGQKTISVASNTFGGALVATIGIGVIQLIVGLVGLCFANAPVRRADLMPGRRTLTAALGAGIGASINILLLIAAFQAGAGALERTVVVGAIGLMSASLFGHLFHTKTDRLGARETIAVALFVASTWAVLGFPTSFEKWLAWVPFVVAAGLVGGYIDERYKSSKDLGFPGMNIWSGVAKICFGAAGIGVVSFFFPVWGFPIQSFTWLFVAGTVLSGTMIAGISILKLGSYKKQGKMLSIRLVGSGSYLFLAAVFVGGLFAEALGLPQLVAAVVYLIALGVLFYDKR